IRTTRSAPPDLMMPDTILKAFFIARSLGRISERPTTLMSDISQRMSTPASRILFPPMPEIFKSGLVFRRCIAKSEPYMSPDASPAIIRIFFTNFVWRTGVFQHLRESLWRFSKLPFHLHLILPGLICYGLHL